MKKITDYLLGTCYVEISSADISASLSRLNQNRVRFRDTVLISPLTARLRLFTWQTAAAKKILARHGDSCKVLKREGLFQDLKNHRKRIPFALCLLLLTAAALYLPSFVLFVEVSGNVRVPDREILAAAEECGVSFLASGKSIRSEQVKNLLLGKIGRLQWAGVNFHGCVATVSVQEKEEADSPRRQEDYSDVVASRDGILVSLSVLEGESLCHVGQAVREGELLVTGCIEHDYQPQYSHSDAEIYALTQHPMNVLYPAQTIQKEPTGKIYRHISLLVGRKRINLSGNSGIPPTTCDKMYTQKYVTLPGGYRLPLVLVVETWTEYRLVPSSVPAEQARESLLQYSRRQTLEQMLAGEILGGEPELKQEEGFFLLTVNYTCREMIARQRTLYLFEGEHRNDGTYHKRRTCGGPDQRFRLSG